MALVTALACVRCGARYPADRYAQDCAACRPTAPSNLAVVYEAGLRRPRAKPSARAPRNLWRYGDLLPVTESEGISLGEGGSPLHRLEAIGQALGVAALYAKDETRNPTWSFKDRLACLAVSAARKMGARTIVSSSSGNAGAAAAAYAAKAGLPCVIFTFKGTAGPMVTQMRAYGAKVVAVQNKADRWALMQMAVRRYGWFPTSPFFGPAVGSNPYGIEGYKTLAYEIAEQLDWQVPDCCILPVCYGDALLGMWRGFEDIMAFGWTDRMPRMIAAEVYGSLEDALARGGDALADMPQTHASVAVSIGATRGTYQSLDILRRSGGTAVRAANDDIVRWHQRLALAEGLYVEPSAAATLAALEQLRRIGTVGADDKVVILLTAGGLKDPAATERVLADTLEVPADLEAATRRLRAEGIFPE